VTTSRARAQSVPGPISCLRRYEELGKYRGMRASRNPGQIYENGAIESRQRGHKRAAGLALLLRSGREFVALSLWPPANSSLPRPFFGSMRAAHVPGKSSARE